ncbi:MAG: aminofutalosine synthase MqnE [Nitrospirae bacterium]|nr:aminofutalosine synthase MqnE [Nitrospirota bacterium]
MELKRIEEKVRSGERINRSDAIKLFRSNDLLSIGHIADYATKRRSGDYVYFIINRHINPTNICINRCALCAFSKDKNENGSYSMTIDEIMDSARKIENGTSEFHIVGGLNPELDLDYYLCLIKALKNEFLDVHIQAFTAVEIDYLASISDLTVREVLSLLKEAGLGSLPGGGAEIFNSSVRRAICDKKISGERWLEVMETAHRLGLRSNSTMLYGHLESFEDRVDHLERLRNLQDKTGGFQSFIPLSFHSLNTRVEKKGLTTGFDDLKTLAISRIFLDNFNHIKAFWIMLGEKIAQVSLNFGVDDIDGTIVEEKITHAAGAQTGEEMSKEELINLIKKAGKIPVERDTLYNETKVYG